MGETVRVSGRDLLRLMIALIFSSTLKLIGDNGVVLYHRFNVEGYQECQGDILTVSGMAEDIRDALLEYQVSGSKFHALVGH